MSDSRAAQSPPSQVPSGGKLSDLPIGSRTEKIEVPAREVEAYVTSAQPKPLVTLPDKFFADRPPRSPTSPKLEKPSLAPFVVTTSSVPPLASPAGLRKILTPKSPTSPKDPGSAGSRGSDQMGSRFEFPETPMTVHSIPSAITTGNSLMYTQGRMNHTPNDFTVNRSLMSEWTEAGNTPNETPQSSSPAVFNDSILTPALGESTPYHSQQRSEHVSHLRKQAVRQLSFSRNPLLVGEQSAGLTYKPLKGETPQRSPPPEQTVERMVDVSHVSAASQKTAIAPSQKPEIALVVDPELVPSVRVGDDVLGRALKEEMTHLRNEIKSRDTEVSSLLDQLAQTKRELEMSRAGADKVLSDPTSPVGLTDAGNSSTRIRRLSLDKASLQVQLDRRAAEAAALAADNAKLKKEVRKLNEVQERLRKRAIQLKESTSSLGVPASPPEIPFSPLQHVIDELRVAQGEIVPPTPMSHFATPQSSFGTAPMTPLAVVHSYAMDMQSTLESVSETREEGVREPVLPRTPSRADVDLSRFRTALSEQTAHREELQAGYQKMKDEHFNEIMELKRLLAEEKLAREKLAQAKGGDVDRLEQQIRSLQTTVVRFTNENVDLQRQVDDLLKRPHWRNC